MKKLAIVTLIIFSISLPLMAKRKSSSSRSNRGTAHRMNKTHTKNSGNKSCQVCETNFATCMQNAANAQMKTMCSQMKDKCRASNKC